jgi:hypothetical protein
MMPTRGNFGSWPGQWNTELLSLIHAIQDEMIANGAMCIHSIGKNPYEARMLAESNVHEQPL